MNTKLYRRSIIFALISVMALGIMASFSSSSVITATEDDEREGYRVAVLVVDTFRSRYNDNGQLKARYREDENCALNGSEAGFAAYGSGFAVRDTGFATRDTGFATRDTGFATRDTGFATRDTGFATRDTGFATRDTNGDLYIPAPHGSVITLELDELNYYYGEDVYVDVLPVKVNDYRTNKIERNIRRAINTTDYDFYIINMSFAIVPCDVVTDFEAYIEEISDDPEYDDLMEVGEYLESLLVDADYSQVANDPMSTMFTEYNIVGVASAGNFGLDFPFYPAAFDGVISVSGSEDANDFYSSASFMPQNNFPLLGWDEANLISNDGEVMMPGRLRDVRGTSYAAPRLSYAVALYLNAVGPEYCRTERGTFGLDSELFNNATLIEATQAHCPDMVQYLPTELGLDPDGDGFYYVVGEIQVEDSDFSDLRGDWNFAHDPIASEGSFVTSGDGFFTHVEVDFSGPYLELSVVDGVDNGLAFVFVDDRLVDVFFTRAFGDNRISYRIYDDLGDGNHTLEVYAPIGYVSLDSVYSAFRVQS